MVKGADIGYDLSVDIWSLGCILFELLSGTTLYQLSTNEDIQRPLLAYCILHENVPIHSIDVNAEASDLLEKLLNKNPTQRLDCDEIKIHTFFE